MNAVFQKALDFATQAHAGQLYNREPYIKHCKRVAASVARLSANPDLPVAALLHDVVEDTPITLDDLRREFGSAIAEIVDPARRRSLHGLHRSGPAVQRGRYRQTGRPARKH